MACKRRNFGGKWYPLAFEAIDQRSTIDVPTALNCRRPLANFATPFLFAIVATLHEE